MLKRMIRRLAAFQQLMIRAPLGVIFIAHGGQNLFGWWGGSGLVQSIHSFEAFLGIPAPVTVLAIFVEFFGGLLVLVGLVTRPAALALAVVMIVAMVKVHLPNGFFMNWDLVAGRGHGIEMNVALLGMCLALAVGGSGAFAVDRPRD